MGTSKNIDFIRYADVLLFKAEALIQLGRLNEALPIINQIRQRASQSTGRTLAAGASNIYKVSLYSSFPNKDFAMKALKFERRLEFAMEGYRFFDLVRWGEAATVLNAYLATEKQRRDFLANAKFTAGRDEYYPIPQREIDFTKGLYKQNQAIDGKRTTQIISRSPTYLLSDVQASVSTRLILFLLNI